jgi:hypothetical protein
MRIHLFALLVPFRSFRLLAGSSIVVGVTLLSTVE